MVMAGVSSKAAGRLKNKEKTFQGQRFDDDLELNWVQFKWRNHDPQIGRFIQIDPLTEDYVYNSTFAFSENKVTGHIELEGLEAVDIRGLVEKGIRENSTNVSEASVGKVMSSFDAGQVKGGMIAVIGLKIAGITALMILQPEIGTPLAIADITGVPVNGAPTSVVETTLSSELSTATSTIEKNAAQGAAFEQKVASNLATAGDTKIAPQITIKAENGVKTRVDFISTTKSGQLSLTEAKSSSTAPLTGNQKIAFPSIAQNGGVIVGNGKLGYPGGTVIPPTQINIVRPAVVDNTYVRYNFPIIPFRKNQNQ